MTTMTNSVLFMDPDLGRIFVPQAAVRSISLPGAAVRRAHGEIGVFVAKQKRQLEDGLAMIWHSITHNERVDKGAAIQDTACFTGGTISAFKVLAVAKDKTTWSKLKGDVMIGGTALGTTTYEYVTGDSNGLARATGTLGTYVAPSSLGGQFSRPIANTFTVSGSGGTAGGAALFDSTTTASGQLYVEDQFGSNAILVSGDSLAVTVTISN